MLKETLELHRQGRFAEAEQGYRDWLEEHPNDADVMHALGLLRHQRGETAEAVRLLERAHAIAPDDPRIDLGMASMRLQLGEQEAAQLGFERALSLNPNLTGAHIGLGQIMLTRTEYDRAEQHFRIALRADEDPHALAGIGALSLARGEAEAALRYLMRAAELEPNSALIQFLLGQAFTQRGTPAFAEQAYENALRIDPHMHRVRPWLAEHLIRDRRAAEAEPHYLRLREVPGFEQNARLGLADVARAAGRLEEAVAGYRAALEIDPTLSMPTRALAMVLAKLGRNDEVVEAYSRYLEHVPDDDEMRALRADISMLTGQWPQAAFDLQVLSERNPADMAARNRLAVVDEYMGRLDTARAHAGIVLQAQPDDAEMQLIRIRALLQNGEDAPAREALEAFGRLALSEGQSRLRWNYLGRLHDRAGETAGAVRCFAEAQRDVPAGMPPLNEPRPELAEALTEMPGEPWPDAPILLLGMPGSNVERIAELLADQQPAIGVLRDRIGTVLRDDDFTQPRFRHYCGPLDEAERAALRERYLAPLRERGIGPGRPIVDWLPRWDAHLLALVRRAMPGTRLILVERDPRDALLNWLAFGFVPGFPCADAQAGAQWLARARAHLNHGAELEEPRRLVVDADAVLADPPAAGAELARFLGLEPLQPGPRFAFTMHGLGGLPIRFPAGHWQDYRQALAEPFRLLE